LPDEEIREIDIVIGDRAVRLQYSNKRTYPLEKLRERVSIEEVLSAPKTSNK
jgi:hypothetical protein